MLVTIIVNPSHLKQISLDMKRTIGGLKASSKKIKMYHSISYLGTTTEGTSLCALFYHVDSNIQPN